MNNLKIRIWINALTINVISHSGVAKSRSSDYDDYEQDAKKGEEEIEYVEEFFPYGEGHKKG